MNADKIAGHTPLVFTRRGQHTENVYYGSYAVVDNKGQVVESAGDIETPIFTRSALKPMQALPLLAHPSLVSFELEPADIALMCASHNGEPAHAERAQKLLSRIGANSSALQCGVHAPYWYTANNQPVPQSQTWSALQHNCSGKHSGFILLSHALGKDPSTYLQPDDVVQSAVRKAVAHAAGYGNDVNAMPWGIDGCSAPNYALPLSRLARAFAWLSQPHADARFGEARVRIYDAMAAHPDMVSGQGRNDLDLARAGRGAWVNKIGAEAVQTLGSRKHGIGIALKISDGNNTALMVAFCAILERLGLLDDHAKQALEKWAHPKVKNIRGNDVGEWQALV
jgi:L-asparaginase II